MSVHDAHILLLQGPLGPFFEDLADAVDAAGMISHRIPLNMGDRCYSKGQYITPYTGEADDWHGFLRAYLGQWEIQCVVLYGDSRHYHRVARDVCKEMDIPVLCLEEGYIRPGYITAEWGGNNVNSPLMQQDEIEPHYDQPAKAMDIPGTFSERRFWGIIYYHMKFYFGLPYIKYKHHRSITAFGEMVKWTWSGVRKYSVRSLDKKTFDRVKSHKGRIFFCPLQVAVDAQIIHHSNYDSMEDFIGLLIAQFSKACLPTDMLLLKNHPMDRGFKHYARLINQQARKAGIEQQVAYTFDMDINAIFEKATACITINSTVGFESIKRGLPTYLFGPAFYEKLGSTPSSIPFDKFIADPKINHSEAAVAKFEECLKKNALVSGDFYAKRDITATSIVKLIVKYLYS